MQANKAPVNPAGSPGVSTSHPSDYFSENSRPRTLPHLVPGCGLSREGRGPRQGLSRAGTGVEGAASYLLMIFPVASPQTLPREERSL